MNTRLRWSCLLRVSTIPALAALALACSSNSGNGGDGGVLDSGVLDSGVLDSGVPETPLEGAAPDAPDASGPSWSQVGLDGNIIPYIAIDPKTPTTVFASAAAGGADVGVFRSKDSGKTWTKLGGVLPTTLGGGAILVHPTQNLVITTVGAAGIFRSTDGGDTWAAAMGGPGDLPNFALDPTNNIVWTADSLVGIWRSADGGATWQKMTSTGLPPLNTVGFGPLAYDGAKLYLGTGGQGVFASSDGGTTWTAAGNGLPMTTIQSFVDNLAVRAARPGVVLAATTAAGLFRTDNAGMSWMNVNVGPVAPRYAALIINPVTPTTLYTSEDDSQGGTGGLIRSTDDGKTWSVLGPMVGTRCVDVSPDGATVFVGTIGKGVWRYGT